MKSYEEKKNEGRKNDTGKLRWSLAQYKALEEYVKVLMGGATEYGDNNWKLVMAQEGGVERYRDALQRHLSEIQKGNSIDPKSGLSHYAHIICNAAFLLEWELENK